MRTVLEAAYVLTVAATATLGFVTGSTSMIVVAALLGLPTSAVAVIAYYGSYGLLAQVAGANPSSSNGSAGCSADAHCYETTTGDTAAWLSLATDVIGVVALTAAAVVNVVLLRLLTAGPRRPVDDDFRPEPAPR